MRWVSLLPHFIDEEAEAETDEATLLKSPRWQVVEARTEPTPPTPEFGLSINTLGCLPFPSQFGRIKGLLLICPIRNTIKQIHTWLQNRIFCRSRKTDWKKSPPRTMSISCLGECTWFAGEECSERPWKLITREKSWMNYPSDPSTSKILEF